MVLHDISTPVNREVTRDDGRERQKVMEKGEDRDMYGGAGGNDGGQKADSTARNNGDGSGGVGGKRAVTTEFDCCVCYAILSSMLQRLLRGGGGSLQVDELVHQQQGARQAGQAGFRATTVTTRVAS